MVRGAWEGTATTDGLPVDGELGARTGLPWVPGRRNGQVSTEQNLNGHEAGSRQTTPSPYI